MSAGNQPARPVPSLRSSSDTRHTISRRAVLAVLGVGFMAPLLAACGGGPAPQGQPSGPGSSSQTARKPESIVTASTSSSATTESVARSAQGAPKGKVVYAWQTTIAPVWLDPLEAQPQVTPYNFLYAVHDALVKHMPGKPLAPSLAESYEIAPDFKSATFRLRPGLKFHDGSPVTPEDVKFTFEKYKGANASVLQSKTERIEAVNDHTIRFTFKEPFLDFLVLYGSPASGAGWIVPKAYYERVGPNGFKQKPIGAGPFKLVRQQPGTELEFEANTDYWRKTPGIKTLVMKGVPEGSTRVAMLQTGEADIINQVPGDLLESIKRNPKLQLVPTVGGTVWMEFPGFEKPESPFHDVRVRQAVSLAIDRKAISDAEFGGMATLQGNWIPDDWPGASPRPAPPFDLAKAKQLMAEAGKGSGFDVEQLTPLPPYTTLGERLVSQLRAINIRTKLNTLERGAFYERLAPGPNRLKGLIIQVSGAPGDAMARIRENATCKGAFSGTCIPDVEERVQRYDASTNPQERQQLLNEIQAYLMDNQVFVPIFRNAFILAQGPRIANKPSEIIGAIPQYVFPGPYEDIQVKE